jgi:hypothetical protein
MPITIFPPIPIATASTVLPPNAAQELNGQLQRVGDLMEMAVIELRVVSTLLSQINDPITDSPENIRNDPMLLS